ncbi:expressed unknown protein [Seminavis robusta]|uniref:Uncharacterized protein n=1 Tax=Seminavis robusta TaxID=568900 RepID=A0A9N8H218_9STRA|nr:expressed unknown protein [Seminavis robusta]|eukprot:Sro11_g008620.1 n/a (332) ;mRNA; f:103149-104144
MANTTPTKSLRQSVRDQLQSFVSTQEATGDALAVDVWRILQEESKLLYETQCIRDMLDQDPFQCYGNNNDIKKVVQRFQQCLQVTSCHRLEKEDDYCLYQATVQINTANNTADATMKKSNNKPSSPMHKKPKRLHAATTFQQQLHFHYERQPATETTATAIWYSIDVSKNYGPKQNLLTIRCWADGNKPSRLPAVSIEEEAGEDDDDDWEDVSEEEEDDNETKSESKQPPKNGTKSAQKTTVESNSKTNGNEEEPKEKDDRDRYACFLDPDVLQSFQTCANLTEMDEATAFFTLMTFQFYQHEWDLVGFVLDSVFGYNDEEEEGEGEEGET